MPRQSAGFSLVELLIVLAIFGVFTGMMFSSLDEGQRISAIAREESEMNQNLQDALGLMTSELRFIGFPPRNYYDLSYLEAPSSPKNLVAVGIVAATNNFIRFQGDINGDRVVDYVDYSLGGGSPPFTLQRFAGSLNPDGSLPGGTAQKLSEQVENFNLRYFDRVGIETTNIPDVASIEIQLTVRTRHRDLSGIYRTVSEITRIHPLNL